MLVDYFLIWFDSIYYYDKNQFFQVHIIDWGGYIPYVYPLDLVYHLKVDIYHVCIL
jgi:hypothetical protein